MSDREISGFRVDTVAGAVRQPPLDELRAVARSRRRRSRGLGATALALLAALVVTPLVAQTARSGSTAPTSPSPSRGLPGKPGDFTLTGPESGVDVRVDGCLLRFARTTDGGRTWSDWDDARYQATRCEPGRAGLEYSVLGDGIYLVYDGGLRRLSTDHGGTWQDANQAISAVPAFPATARPVPCHFTCQAVDEPLAVDPSTGKVYRLTGPPPTPLQLFSLYPASDGSIWTTYETGGATVGARSMDRGATWTTWTPPAGENLLALVGVDSREGYQIVSGGDEGVELQRTTDGGRHWSTTLVGLPEGPHWDLTVGVDGSLLAITLTGPEGHRVAEMRVSRDDGQTLTVARGDGMPVASVSVAPGYAWLFVERAGSGGEADRLLLTQDGRVWTHFLLAS
ncbi:WD40/YVTN/BNR-like repeat-containing protein [Micromonospora sp. NPDC005299]|uniref:WD40/YVTN/BNR-like repeat-containing protein n=1 Tax=Micromonospora sp. NPDC005299 TaxID=3364231 RepID=UPI0036A5E429